MTFLLLACAAQPIPNTALSTGPTSFDDWVPFSYRDFANSGGQVTPLVVKTVGSPQGQVTSLGALDGTIQAIMTNTGNWSICLPVGVMQQTDTLYALPAASIASIDGSYRAGWRRQDYFHFMEMLHAIPEKAENITVKIKPGKSITVTLSTDGLVEPPQGQYTLYYHIFAPECRAVRGRRVKFSSPYELRGLAPSSPPKAAREAYGFPIPATPTRLRFKYLRNGDYVSITNTRGILFTARLPLEIEGPVEPD